MDNSFDNLKNIFGLFNPELYQRGEQALNISRDQSLQNLMQSRQTFDQREQKFPLELRGMELGNQTNELQLPGVQAQSDMLQRKNKFESATEDEALNELVKSYRDKEHARELKQLQDTGTAYGQAYSVLESLPGPSRHAYAKQVLGKNYLPDFEQIPPDQLPGVLKSIAERSSMISSKVQARLAEEAAKSDRALQLETLRQQGRERVQAIRITAEAERKRAVQNKDPDDLQALATQYFVEARRASTPEEAQALTEAGNAMIATLYAMKQAGAPAPLPGIPEDPRTAPTVPVPPPIKPSMAPGTKTGDPAPAVADRKARQEAQKYLYASNPKTGERIMSKDGGKNWEPVK